ncbi:hypothetical protein CDAR_406131 [Caerostris darwini]|uniref:Uncharacterized protein n=1 Tax=Caerostris darwini TaxID=1538125 RepID=A0AAV4MT84_9ARAC|nr:hypothetical protein CDAR_406131 [Caerostris darwini]
MLIESMLNFHTFCFRDGHVPMASRKQMEDSECWCVVRRIEAGQSITDVALFFGFHHSVISQLWKTIPKQPNSSEDMWIVNQD